MKKIKFITPLVGLATITPVTVLNTSCSTSKWTNKMYVQLGDSITWNDGHTNTKTKETLRGYRTHMKSMGFKDIQNMGYSGASVAQRNAKYFDLPYIVSTVNFKDYDLVTFAAGVNDFAYTDVVIGEFKTGGYDDTTFIGSYQWMIEKIRNDNPNIKIAIFTPYICRNYNVPNKVGNVLVNYVDATIAVAKHYNIPCFDMYRNSGITADNLSTYTFDNLHLNNAGYDFVCPKMIDFLNKI